MFAASLIGACNGQSVQPADLVLINGKILTVDPNDTVVEAIAVTNGKVAAVGSTGQIRSRVGERTRVIDLCGQTATPGLIDSHVHFSEAGALFTIDLGDGTVTNIDEVKARVAARVKSVPPGEWVRGEGWDEGKLAERRHITAGDLDAVAPDNPVWLRQTTGHYGVANSYAMRLAGITRTTQAPPAGTIARNVAGNPTGVLMESAQNLVTSRIPPLTRDQQKQGLIKIIEDFNREGMTGPRIRGSTKRSGICIRSC
jgi:predicted amidohydrolase YtcJ